MIGATFSKLHKYKAIDSHLEELIVDRELHFSGRLRLNDPNEAILRFTKQQVLVDDGLQPSRIEELDSPRYCPIGNYYFFCMSREPADIPMWGYYGDNHRGVCLEFDFSVAIPQWIGERDKPWKIETDHGIAFIRDVHYDDHLDGYLLAPDGHPNLSPNESDVFGFSKLNCWSGEKEVRMRLTRNPTTADESMPEGIGWRFDKDALKAIRFGVRTDESEKSRIVRIARSHGYQCEFLEGYDIGKAGGQFRVLFRPYGES